MTSAMSVGGYCLAWAVLGAATWTLLASMLLLVLCGMFYDVSPAHRLLWWWLRLPHFGENFFESLYIVFAAAAPGMLGWRFIVWQWNCGRVSASLPFSPAAPAVIRSKNANLGTANWMSMEQAKRIFHPGPDPETGVGVVVGEAYEVWRTRYANVRYNPHDRSTWGDGWKHPLLVDHCKDNPGHSMVIAGSRANKSVAAVTQLLTWKKSIICLDPSTELAPQVEEALTDSGRRVIRMGLGDIGFNVLDAIVPGDPEAETRMAALVRRMIGDAPKDAGGEAKQWKDWGKQLILAILADMIWSDGPSEAKTLQQMRSRLALPEDEARKLLENIHKNSPNRLARENAAIYSLPQPTFGGVLGNAHRDTGWISNESYAKLVSGNRFNPADITKGDLAVFLQIPEDVLEESPYVARVLIGSMMEAQFKANGSGDWTFLLVDDAVIMDSEPLMRSVLNLGGKHKIVVQYNYQSESQIERVWGGEKAKNELFASLAWRSYTRVQELSTAKSLSEHLGRYGVVASSRGTNKGRSGPMMGMGSASSGSNTNEHDIGKNLMDASEILSRMRTDERVVLLGGSDALRVSSAIGMRRPEIRVKLGLNPYANR